MKADIQSDRSRSWLCIAYAYPPIQRSGTHRTAAFVRGLDAHGWRATVLTVRPPSGDAIDDKLMEGVPAATRIVRSAWIRPVDWIATRVRRWFRPPTPSSPTHSQHIANADGSVARPTWRAAISKLLHTPDSRIGWVLPGITAGMAAIRRDKPEILYSTSPYASAHLIALVLHWFTRIPWVADFRDPWCGNPFEAKHSSLAERLNQWLEARVIRGASKIICNTPTMEQSFARRYPELREKISTIMNGVDKEVLAAVQPQRIGGAQEFVFAHCGQFYGPRTPTTLFSALCILKSEYPAEASRIRLALIGSTSYQGRPLADIAAETGVADRVVICGERSHRETLCLAAGADALVLMGAAGAGDDIQIPQKLYEYLALRRPVLALIGRENPAAQVLRESVADAIICEPDNAANAAQAMRQLSDPARWRNPAAWGGVSRFDRSSRVRELLAHFEDLVDLRGRADNPSAARQRPGPRSLDEFRDPSMMPA